MKRYSVVISKPAAKYLSKLSGKMYASIGLKITELETNPFPQGQPRFRVIKTLTD